MADSFTPFFVADRPASLRILSGLDVPYGKHFGIMTHANTASTFKVIFRSFPCVCLESCSVIGGNPCPHNGNVSKCVFGTHLKNSVLKICDSGVFQKKGCGFTSYEDLFSKYSDLDVDYGIIMDFLKDKDRTLETAKEAISTYNSGKYSFKLIGVAQGKTIEEYVECYKGLKKMGYEHIAVGGMLQRKEKSARYVHVRNESFLRDVLTAIREIDPDGWLFALGCYSPGRQSIFLENSVFGADYKGWIFQYEGHSPKRGNLASQKSRFFQVRGFIQKDVLARPQIWRKGSRLLIVSCSEDKIQHKGSAQAINVYNGPIFKMLRKRVHSFSNEDGLDIMILSAKYGLIEPKKSIKNYNLRMTSERAFELQNQVSDKLNQMANNKQYSDILVNLGKEYLGAIEPSLDIFGSAKVVILNGRIGERLKETKTWLLS